MKNQIARAKGRPKNMQLPKKRRYSTREIDYFERLHQRLVRNVKELKAELDTTADAPTLIHYAQQVIKVAEMLIL
jgi:hypothetical protein